MRILEAYWSGGEEAVKTMQWGGGGTRKHKLSADQVDTVVSREALTAQAHLSLAARAEQFNRWWAADGVKL